MTTHSPWSVFGSYAGGLSSDAETHLSAFDGNAIADWSGTVLIVMAIKWLFEQGFG